MAVYDKNKTSGVYVPEYFNQNAELPPSMQDAIQQAKVNLGYAKPQQPSGMPSSVYNNLTASQISKYPTPTATTTTTATSTPKANNASATQTVYSKTGNMNTKPSGMPTSDYEKYLAMQESQANNSNRSVWNSLNNLKDTIKSVKDSVVSNGSESGNSGNGSNSGAGNATSAAMNYYNNSINALQDAYQQKLAGLQGNLTSQQNLLKSDFDLSRNNLAADAERALQEAYINRMMNERSLQQQLNAQGINGGATESTIASMLNNYGTSRNNINTAYGNNLAQLEQAYLNNLAQAQQSYNEAVAKAASDNANYRMELENALYKAMLG
jgi:hypothetical protein